MKQILDLVRDLGIAVVLGALLSYGPGYLLPFGRKLRRELAQSIILLCAASALAVLVIGDSTARAFGLVGLGAFVRFRTPLRDPRDAAAMFMGIGLGMATGIGHHEIGLVACVLFTLLLAVLGARDGLTLALRVDCDDPAAAAPPARAALDGRRVRVLSQETDPKKGRLKFRVETREVPDEIAAALRAAVPGARGLRWEVES